jgi:hypothetical protein
VKDDGRERCRCQKVRGDSSHLLIDGNGNEVLLAVEVFACIGTSNGFLSYGRVMFSGGGRGLRLSPNSLMTVSRIQKWWQQVYLLFSSVEATAASRL